MTVQLKVVPGTPDVSIKFVVFEEHKVWVSGVVVIVGVGFTVTTTSKGVPVQPLASGVV